MSQYRYIPFGGKHGVKSYVFKVVVEPDEGRWSAYCPALLKQGASTWGETEEEALQHIDEVVQWILSSVFIRSTPMISSPGRQKGDGFFSQAR